MTLTTRSGPPALPRTFNTPYGAFAVRSATRPVQSVPQQHTRGWQERERLRVPLRSSVVSPRQGASGIRSCSGCGCTHLTDLTVTLNDGSPVAFVLCQECDRTRWVALDGPARGIELSLAVVLERTHCGDGDRAP